jgi:hypothetical protein
VGEAVAVAVGVGLPGSIIVGAGVTLGGGVGVGVGRHSEVGPMTGTMMGAPDLKKPMVAFTTVGGLLSWTRKLYMVPQRKAFAFGFWAKVSECQLIPAVLPSWAQGTLL